MLAIVLDDSGYFEFKVEFEPSIQSVRPHHRVSNYYSIDQVILIIQLYDVPSLSIFWVETCSGLGSVWNVGFFFPDPYKN